MKISALALVLDQERLRGLERRIDQVAEAAAGLEHRTVARMLRQQGARALATRLDARAGPARVAPEDDVHGPILPGAARECKEGAGGMAAAVAAG
jgi:hypothetical protein